MEETLVLLLYIIVLLPFGMMGVWWIVKDKLRPWFFSRRGYIKIWQILANGRYVFFYGRPQAETSTPSELQKLWREGKLTDQKYNELLDKLPKETAYTIKRKDKSFNYIESSDTVFFDGPIRAAFYDPEGNQLSLKSLKRYMSPLSPIVLNSMGERLWNLARAIAFQEKRKIEIFSLVAAGFALIAVLAAMSLHGRFDELASNIEAVKAVCVAAKTAAGGLVPT